MRNLMRFLAMCVASWITLGMAAQEPELLESEAAFRFSAQKRDSKTIEVTFAIADGYYMYRDKFRFQVSPSDIALGTPRYPVGKIKQDPLFGKVETYRKSVKILLPIAALPADGKLTLTTVSQGCADIGVCYMPMTSQAAFGANGAVADSKPMSSLMKR